MDRCYENSGKKQEFHNKQPQDLFHTDSSNCFVALLNLCILLMTIDLLFHVTQLVNRNNTESHHTKRKTIVAVVNITLINKNNMCGTITYELSDIGFYKLFEQTLFHVLDVCRYSRCILK